MYTMADTFPVASGVLGVVSFGFQSAGSLLSIIEEFQKSPSAIAHLKDELVALRAVLKSLETAIIDNSYNFSELELPVRQCGEACREFEATVMKYSVYSVGNSRSILDWTKLKYRGDDLNTFKAMLGSYRATIAVALCDANLRTTKVTRTALNEYKQLIQTTCCDLEFRLQHIDNKLQALLKDPAHTSLQEAPFRQHIEVEKKVVRTCLEICVHVSENIDNLLPGLIENISTPPEEFFVAAGPNRITTATTLENCNAQLQTASMWLRSHLGDIERQLVLAPASVVAAAAASSASASSSPSFPHITHAHSAEKARLQKEVETLQKSLEVCEEAAKQADQERKNVIEDIEMAEDGYQIIVSTVGDLMFARNVKGGPRSTQVLGQVSDASLRQILLSRQDESPIGRGSKPVRRPH